VSWPRWLELGRISGRWSSRFTARAPAIERDECARLRQGCLRANGFYRRGREEGARRTDRARGRAHAGLGERRRADQGRTRVCVISVRVLARVVTRPCLLLPWSVHKTSSPSLKLPILCGGQMIWPTGSRDMEHSSRICLTARARGKSLVLLCLRPESQCHLQICGRGVSLTLICQWKPTV
jgi:hypothetical protein